MSGVLFCFAVVTAQAQWTSHTPFGGNTTHHTFGGQTGTSHTPFGGNTTYYSGSLFRGGEEPKSVLFKDDYFIENFNEGAWLDAVASRNTKAMTNGAWNLKMLEAVNGKADSKTTSTAMFESAAEVAVNQQNAEGLKAIVALCPPCSKYQDRLKAIGKSRGKINFPSAMPEVVWFPSAGQIPFEPGCIRELEETLPIRYDTWEKSLKPWETPGLTPDLLQFKFRGMGYNQANSIATVAGLGRSTMEPRLIAQASVLLSKVPGSSKDPVLTPEKLLLEAAELAIIKNDAASLSSIVGLMDSKELGIVNSEVSSKYNEMLKVLGKSRGASKPQPVDLLIFLPLEEYLKETGK